MHKMKRLFGQVIAVSLFGILSYASFGQQTPTSGSSTYYAAYAAATTQPATPIMSPSSSSSFAQPAMSTMSSSYSSSYSTSSSSGYLTGSPSSPTSPGQVRSSDYASFNPTALPINKYLWITADMTPTFTSGTGAVTLRFTDASVTLTLWNGRNTIYKTFTDLPKSTIIFDPSATKSTVTYDSATNTWLETAPKKSNAGILLDAYRLQLTATNLPSGYSVASATFSGNFASDSHMQLNWKFGSAVYSSSFSQSYNLLGVKPVDDDKTSTFKNSDPAGTPENAKSYLLPGGTGYGGTNYTGNSSCWVYVTPYCPPATRHSPHDD